MNWLEIGKIVAAQGLKGELRVYPDTDFPQRFQKPGQRWLQRPGQPTPEPVKLTSGRYLEGKGLYIITLSGITSREQAEALCNARLLVPATDRPCLEPGEFHVADLVGLAVFDQASQQQIGHVTDILSAGNDLLEVELLNGKKALIPFVEPIVPIVDLANRRLEITPPAGLIED